MPHKDQVAESSQHAILWFLQDRKAVTDTVELRGSGSGSLKAAVKAVDRQGTDVRRLSRGLYDLTHELAKGFVHSSFLHPDLSTGCYNILLHVD